MPGEAWPEIRIGDLGEVFTGRTPSSDHPAYFGDDLPFITPGDMHQGKYARATERSLSLEGAALLKRIKIPANSICVSCIGWQMGEAIMTAQPSFTNQQINTIVPSSKVEPSFLYYSLRPRKQELLSLGAAAGVRTPILNKSAFCDLKVKIPPLSVQHWIAGILSAYDDLIENNNRRIKILEEMAQMIYREWFVNFLFPDQTKIKKVNSSLGPIPQGWTVKRLGELIAVDKGVSYNGAGLTEDGNPMVNLKNILPGGGFRRDATKPYSGDFKLRHTVKPGDVVLANTDLTQVGNIVATPVLIPYIGDGKPILISHHLFAVRCLLDVSPLFLYHLMLEEGFRGFAKGFAVGTTVLGMPKEGILDFTFACPPLSLIKRFVEHVSPSHALVETLYNQSEKLSQTRDLLLPKLISGETNVEHFGREAVSQIS